jgi:deazaflavin-dependent oxidoreductase (nitroreductase family)
VSEGVCGPRAGRRGPHTHGDGRGAAGLDSHNPPMSIADKTSLAFVALHRSMYRLSGGRLLGGFGGMPVLELTTTGARSGKQRTTMLTVPLRYHGSRVVVASKGGSPESPGWYHNLVANPQVTVTEKGKSTELRARVLRPDEREEVWPKIVAAYKGYGNYQEKTPRTIPVVVLEPA